MDSYVVRIYRRDSKDPRGLVGVVQRAEVAGEQAFHDAEELMGILASPGPRQRAPKSESRARKKRRVT